MITFFLKKDFRAGLPESVIQSWLQSAMQSLLAARPHCALWESTLGLIIFNICINDLVMGWSVPSACLQMILKWPEWLTPPEGKIAVQGELREKMV